MILSGKDLTSKLKNNMRYIPFRKYYKMFYTA